MNETATPSPLAPASGSAGRASSVAAVATTTRRFCLLTATSEVVGSNAEPIDRLPGAAPLGAAEIRITTTIAQAQAKDRRRYNRVGRGRGITPES